jgi:hypothetical protein
MEVFFHRSHLQKQNQAVARLTEPFRLEMKKSPECFDDLSMHAFFSAIEVYSSRPVEGLRSFNNLLTLT